MAKKTLKEKINNLAKPFISIKGPIDSTRGKIALGLNRTFKYFPEAIATSIGVCWVKNPHLDYVGGLLIGLATYSTIDKAINQTMNGVLY